MFKEIRSTGSGLKIMSSIEAYVTKGQKVLNVGSGDGVLSQHLRELGCEVDDIDVNDLVTNTSLPSPILFDGSTIPADADTYDLVLCVYVLHHAHNNQGSLMTEMIRVTRDSIIIVEDTPRRVHHWILAWLHAVVSYIRSWSGWCTFRSEKDWLVWFKQFQQLKLVAVEVAFGIWIYPIPRRCFVMRKTKSIKDQESSI